MNEEQALSKLKSQLLVGTLLLGGVSGLVRGFYGGGDLHPALHGVIGLGLALLAGAVGGFAGSLLRGLADVVRGSGKLIDEDTMGGTLLGALVGILLGLVLGSALGRWTEVDIWAACGCSIGGTLGALPGGTANVLLRMLVYDGSGAPIPRPTEPHDEDRIPPL